MARSPGRDLGCWVIEGGWCCHTDHPLRRCNERITNGTCPKGHNLEVM